MPQVGKQKKANCCNTTGNKFRDFELLKERETAGYSYAHTTQNPLGPKNKSECLYNGGGGIKEEEII